MSLSMLHHSSKPLQKAILSPHSPFISRRHLFSLSPALHSTGSRNRGKSPFPVTRSKTLSSGSHLFSPRLSSFSSRAYHMSPTMSNAPSVSTPTVSAPILKEPITRVTTVAQARQVLKVLNAHPEVFWACDTEVADMDLKAHGPVGHGKVTCISVFGGPDVDFGLGEGKGSVLWVENINESEGLLQEFKGWFEDPKYKKVWHNYGFDRHVMFNEIIDCKGFAGDTMHMARLWDTSLDRMEGAGGYSLAALSSLLEEREKQNQLDCNKTTRYANSTPSAAYSNKPPSASTSSSSAAKESMMELFGVPKLTKSGTPSKVKILPSVRELQTDPLHREKWIQYSAKDAVCTFELHRKLSSFLANMAWEVEAVTTNTAGVGSIEVLKQGNMYTFYDNYLKHFGDLLTDMERNGIKVDVKGHLVHAEKKAREDREVMNHVFVEWMSRYIKDAKHVNLGSTTQMQQLFFGHYKDKILLDKTRVFTKEKDEDVLSSEIAAVEGVNKYAKWTAVQIKEELKSRGLKMSGKKAEVLERLLQSDADDDAVIADIFGDSAAATASSIHDDGNSTTSAEESSRPTASLTTKYNGLSVTELQDICTGRRIAVPLADLPEDMKPTLISLIEQDERQFLGQEANRGSPITSSAPSAVISMPVAQQTHGTQSSNASTVPTPSLAEIAQLTTPKRTLDFTIESFGIKPKEFTPAGVPKVGNSVLKELSGSGVFSVNGEPPKHEDVVFGSVYKHFGGGEEGEDACRAIGALASISQVETMISSFLLPLQALADERGRIHCSLNLNTETGRLSSRKPNLQNQPALEKDQYKVRDAFMAEEGNTLLVADYGQLELRLMAHMTQCRSMLEAFESGGCFHSRTAVGMYPHIQEAVARGDVLLEWDYSKGAPPKPLVKDKYGSERRKAKTLNFSIAYGKTVHGLAKDWGISIAEAKETLEAWYRDRPEVRQWQEDTRAMAKSEGYVRTIMGRRRNLKEANSYGAAGSHALRAAINTPIQGSAADVVMMAMIRLWKSEELKRIGWKLLLQIHDEVILEGPKENKDLAMTEVMNCMQNPFDGIGLMPLTVKLEVDAKTADTWYEAK